MHRTLNYIYFLMVRGLDADKREQFDILLTTPPVTAVGRALPQAALEAEGEGFMAFMGATTGRVQ